MRMTLLRIPPDSILYSSSELIPSWAKYSKGVSLVCLGDIPVLSSEVCECLEEWSRHPTSPIAWFSVIFVIILSWTHISRAGRARSIELVFELSCSRQEVLCSVSSEVNLRCTSLCWAQIKKQLFEILIQLVTKAANAQHVWLQPTGLIFLNFSGAKEPWNKFKDRCIFPPKNANVLLRAFVLDDNRSKF